MGPVHHLVGDLLPPVSRKAVEDDGVVLRVPEEVGIDLIPPEGLDPLRRLGLVAHGDPGVGLYDVPISSLLRKLAIGK